ncbi:hypothetical protein HWV62_37466 [Athelia sp. TMB]|nr:hypothetical protein HWV62_37466 [Athelia sp. TMB]
MNSGEENGYPLAEDSEDDMVWEEVDVPDVAEPRNIEITLQARPKQKDVDDKKKEIRVEHLARLNSHKMHTVCLLMNARVRNKWINDELLHARLLSLTPLALQNAFAAIHPSRVSESHHRGHMFQNATERLVNWWAQSFFSVEPVGHIRSKTFDRVQKLIAHLPSLGPKDILDLELLDEEEQEIIRSEKSLMKHALMRSGSRDVSAQLFTALCRALGIPARLVVSLQSVPWQAGVGKPKPRSTPKKKKDVKGKGKQKEVEVEEAVDAEEEMEEVIIDVKGKGKAKDDAFNSDGHRLDGKSTTSAKSTAKAKPVIKLRKQKSKGHTFGAVPKLQPKPRREAKRSVATPDPTTTPPVFWTEVFSRADARWLSVDPIRCHVDKRKVFDPAPFASPHIRQENRMVYVMAFEEDGYARDVTPRYAREYGAKVIKMQGGSKSRKDWWEKVTNMVQRPYRLHRDDLEDQELQTNQLTEGMPTTMVGFKDHPIYALARHLHQNETIHPLVELGKFRGEPVYSRSAVISLKASENWMRSGRKIREGCQPMKWVKQRASTVNRRREIEMTLEREREEKERAGQPSSGVGEEEVLQGLYAESQTELYVPEPIVDGKIPKNDFGNIDLYVPSMLPKGAIHVPCEFGCVSVDALALRSAVKGVAKIARKLGFDFAEAVTGFEFRKRRANPIIEGVVIAAENEPALLEAYLEAEEEAAKKAQTKREERVLKRWTRLVHGLRIRQRLQQQYATEPQSEDPHWLDTQASASHLNGREEHVPEAGGFLTAADDVVQAFHLPKYQHIVAEYSTNAPSATVGSGGLPPIAEVSQGVPVNFEETTEASQDNDDVMNEMIIPTFHADAPIQDGGVPLSMQELADAARQRSMEEAVQGEEIEIEFAIKTPVQPVNGLDRSTRSRQLPSRTRGSAKKRPREESEKPSPNIKRVKAEKVSTPTPTPTRVLRPRAPKSSTQIEEEKQMERAYRDAIAD